MRLSGHMPRGLSVEDAVTLGFDEVNHAAFLFSTFFPDSLLRADDARVLARRHHRRAERSTWTARR